MRRPDRGRRGREVLLRGVNVNALAEYWKGGRFRTVFPLARKDPAGWRPSAGTPYGCSCRGRGSSRTRPLRPGYLKRVRPRCALGARHLHDRRPAPGRLGPVRWRHGRARPARGRRSGARLGRGAGVGHARRRRRALRHRRPARAEPGRAGRRWQAFFADAAGPGRGGRSRRATCGCWGGWRGTSPASARGRLRPDERAQRLRGRRRRPRSPRFYARGLRGRARRGARRAAGGAISCSSSPRRSGRRPAAAPRPTSSATATSSTRRTYTRGGFTGPARSRRTPFAQAPARGPGASEALPCSWASGARDPDRAGEPGAIRYFIAPPARSRTELRRERDALDLARELRRPAQGRQISGPGRRAPRCGASSRWTAAPTGSPGRAGA